MKEITKPRGKAIIVTIVYDSGDQISIEKNANVWVDEISALLTTRDIMSRHPDRDWEEFGVEIEFTPNLDYIPPKMDEKIKEKYKIND